MSRGSFLAILEQAGRLLIYFGVLVLPVANAPITGDTLEIKTHLFRLLGVASAILYVAISLMRSDPSEADAVDLAVLLGMAGVAVSLALAESRVASLPGALDAASGLAIFCLARTVLARTPDSQPNRLHPLVMTAVGWSACLPALLFMAEIRGMGIPDTLGNQNVVSHFLLLTLCAPVYFLFHPNRSLRIGAGLVLAALLWVIWQTAARGAVVGLLVALSVLGVLTAIRLWKRLAAALRAAVVIVCLTIALAAPLLLYQYATSTDFNVKVRFLSWKYSISLLSDRMWTGYGPGSFAASFEKTKLWMADADAKLLGLLSVNYAHNDYVELVVEQGAFGLAAFLFLILACLGPAAVRWVRDGSSWIASLLFSLTASLAQAFFDFPYHTGAPRFLFFATLALTAARPAGKEATVAATAVSWSTAALVALLALVPALPVSSIFAGSVLSKVAEPRFKSGRYDAVKDLHESAARLDPTRSLHFFRLGLGEEQSGEQDGARLSFRNALTLQPYFPNIYFHLGTLALKDDPARASAAFYANLAFMPSSVVLHNLAAMGLVLGDTSTAAALYTEIARRYPDDERAIHNAEVLRLPELQSLPESARRAMDFYQQSRFDLAEPLAAQFLRERPGDPDALFLLGRIIFHQNRYGDAERLFRQYLSYKPDDPEGFYYLGNAYYFQTRYNESLDAYRQAARLNPGSPKTLYNLGVNYYFVGDAASMNDCFDTVLAINPNVSFGAKMEELRRSVRQRKDP